ncbi:MAG TPA: hypothetical protein VN368_01640 [Candidatus Methylomirabilis sp.]|nr:hypothetical protein [Candidatus Methylomirabilis sp.]
MSLSIYIGRLATEKDDTGYETGEMNIVFPSGFRHSEFHDEISKTGKIPDLGEDNICDHKYTLYPNEPIRIVSSDYPIFPICFREKTEPTTITKLTPYIDQINTLKPQDGLMGDRIKWLKYWANKAIDEFGEDAVIMFS